MKYLTILEGDLIVAEDLKNLKRMLSERNIDINLCDNYELKSININNNTVTYK